MNIKRFKGDCDACGKTYDDVAAKLKITRGSVYRKMETDDFDIKEITAIARLLNMDYDEVRAVFFPGNDVWRFDKEAKGNLVGTPDGDKDPDGAGNGPAVPSGSTSDGGCGPVSGGTVGAMSGGRKKCWIEYMFGSLSELFRVLNINEILVRTDRDLLGVEDFKKILGLEADSCRRLMRRIKDVSDVFGVSGHVHRVDYIMYLIMMVIEGDHRDF